MFGKVQELGYLDMTLSEACPEVQSFLGAGGGSLQLQLIHIAAQVIGHHLNSLQGLANLQGLVLNGTFILETKIISINPIAQSKCTVYLILVIKIFPVLFSDEYKLRGDQFLWSVKILKVVTLRIYFYKII